jgi:site-specific recombinase XerD
LLLEGFGEALQSQIVVPHLGESFVLLVQADEVNVVVADNRAAPLLHANVIVAVILCEQPDYVNSAAVLEGLRCVYALMPLAFLHIVWNLPRADNWSARGRFMEDLLKKGLSVAECMASYDVYAREVRGLSAATRETHNRILRRFCSFKFGDAAIAWSAVGYTDCLGFLTAEFERLPNRGTQRVLLTAMRSILRYLSRAGAIADGWAEALPGTPTRRHAHIPRLVSPEQVKALFAASRGKTLLALRDRALLLLFLRLGLRSEEVANLMWRDIDWQDGSLKIRSMKTGHERVLPLPDDLGRALSDYLRTFTSMPRWVFESSRATFPPEKRRLHIKAITRYFFRRAGIVGRSAHSLRHTVATKMVNHGATFKEVADLLGHRWIATTLIYAKLDMKSLAQVALPWPGGAR